MQRIFAKLASSNIKPMNDKVMNGLSTYYLPYATEYIDIVMKSASSSFPKGLEYVGYQRCTPEEEYNEICRLKNSKRYYDLARSDFYLVKYFFRYKGKDLDPRFLYLPFVGDAGILHIGGPAYHITPILSDKVISPGYSSIFIKLLRDKIIVKRDYHGVVINERIEMSQVIWSEIYRNRNKNSSVPKTTNALTCLSHYLYANYGFTKTFMKYCNYIPVVGGDEINENHYPPSKWTIYRSTGTKPRTFKDKFYTGNHIRIAVENNQKTTLVNQLIIEFFYIIDHFPSRFNVPSIDSTDLWKITLGEIIFSGHFSFGKLHANIVEHFQSLSEYADLIVIEKLKEKNYFIEDFFDLLAVILTDFNKLLLHSGVDYNNVYDKTFELLYYVLFDITSGIFSTNFKLNKLATKKQITEKDIVNIFNKHMKIGTIFALSSGKIVTNGVSYSGDHKYPKLTSMVNEQENLAGANRGRKTRRNISIEHRIHTSTIEIGSILFLPKKNPTPIVRINPYVKIDLKTGSIIRKEYLKLLLDRTQEMLAGTRQTQGKDLDISSVDDGIAKEEQS
jgi:hypothetical protein